MASEHTTPSFGDATIADQVYTNGRTAVDLQLPEATGDGTLTYALTPDLPAGLSVDTAASVRKITGAPTATLSETEFTWTATDGDSTDPESAALTFNMTVERDTSPHVSHVTP